MGGLILLRRARLAGLEVWSWYGRLYVEGPDDQEALASEILEHKPEVLAALAAEQAGPWPREEWGPLFAEHFGIKTLDDLDRLPRASTGDGREAAR